MKFLKISRGQFFANGGLFASTAKNYGNQKILEMTSSIQDAAEAWNFIKSTYILFAYKYFYIGQRKAANGQLVLDRQSIRRKSV